jgi:predicted nucleotidyltransferase component of viral defense system
VNYDPAEALAAQEHFGFPSPAPIEKDWHILRAMRAVISVDPTPFQLVFAGGTCLARAHKLIRRMSEDVDFKIAPLDPDSVPSKSKRRKELHGLRERITAALQVAGFPIDATDDEQVRSRDDNRFTSYQLAYDIPGGKQRALRPTIQVELNYVPLRRPCVEFPVASFIAEAFGRSPEIPAIACMDVAEAAAEKLISLTRRTAMELAGLSREPDPTLVRHIYDLHIMRSRFDAKQVIQLAREIMPQDAAEFENQFPAYRDDPLKETRRAVEALASDAPYALRYAEFLQIMVYGDHPGYREAIATVASLARSL